MRISRVLSAIVLLLPASSGAQWTQVYDQFYFPASHNWVFRREHRQADRLFNAFDYGHAILYETLWNQPNAPIERLEGKEYRYLTERLLINPPRLPLEEMAIEPNYARLAPEAKAMFEWAHILHRQVYDVLADNSIADGQRDARIAELLQFYRSRHDVRFSERPKTMALMQEQPYSLAFRERYPKFNGLIWAYHWLQVGLYESLLSESSAEGRRSAVRATVGRFRQMLVDGPKTMPYVMPMTAAIAPKFSTRYPELAIIFDNLHSMHDVISDILANPSVPRDRKRAEILVAASRYRDDTTEVMSRDGWLKMSAMMGLENQGGPAVGFGRDLPTPTVARGYVMRHDREGNMIGDAHAGHVMPAQPTVDEHAGHAMPNSDSGSVASTVQRFHEQLAKGDSAGALDLLADDVVFQGVAPADTKARYRAGPLRAEIARAVGTTRTVESQTVSIRGVVAWVTLQTTTRGGVMGRLTESTGTELMVLEKRNERWLIVAVHRSERAR